MENDAGMIKLYNLDVGKSISVFKKLKRLIEPKFCYNNVFHVVSNFQSQFMDGKWKVAYGYVRTLPEVFCRHCFILDTESGLIIDPTAPATGNPLEDKTYFIMKAFDSLDDYISAIDEENNLPALENVLRDEDMAACKMAFENGLIFIG